MLLHCAGSFLFGERGYLGLLGGCFFLGCSAFVIWTDGGGVWIRGVSAHGHGALIYSRLGWGWDLAGVYCLLLGYQSRDAVELGVDRGIVCRLVVWLSEVGIVSWLSL